MGANSSDCMVPPNICGSSVDNFLQVTTVAPRILMWLLDFSKICASCKHHWSQNTAPVSLCVPSDVMARMFELRVGAI